jgi:hypothetical protein
VDGERRGAQDGHVKGGEFKASGARRGGMLKLGSSWGLDFLEITSSSCYELLGGLTISCEGIESCLYEVVGLVSREIPLRNLQCSIIDPNRKHRY